MSAPQNEPLRPPRTLLVQRVHGLLVIALIATALSTTGWSVAWENRTQVVATSAKAQEIPEPRDLPEIPEYASTGPREIGRDEARKMNASIPFAPEVGSPARPFRFAGSEADRIRATDCLAVAAMAEAGSGDEGQRAVIQVVLNRVRHPAFAKTICGVVFEGSHRASGCQFTFTCDGALARRYSTASWASARDRATQAIGGRVYAPVGLATHYHTDWVHPLWSASLTKLARVETHLFFRWPGQWGNAASLSVPYRGGEPAITQLAYLPAHIDAAEAPAAEGLASQATSDTALRDLVVRNRDGGAFVLLTGAPSAASAREMGRSICMDRPSCKVFGWFDRAAIPRGYPVPSSARSQLGFSYFRDARNNEIVLYDCSRFASVTPEGCIPPTTGMRGTPGAMPARSPVAMTSHPSASSDGAFAPAGQIRHPRPALEGPAMQVVR